jgi:hypothetical protein
VTVQSENLSIYSVKEKKRIHCTSRNINSFFSLIFNSPDADQEKSFEVFTAVRIQVQVFCVETPSRVVVRYQCFGDQCYLHLHGEVTGDKSQSKSSELLFRRRSVSPSVLGSSSFWGSQRDDVCGHTIKPLRLYSSWGVLSDEKTGPPCSMCESCQVLHMYRVRGCIQNFGSGRLERELQMV